MEVAGVKATTSDDDQSGNRHNYEGEGAEDGPNDDRRDVRGTCWRSSSPASGWNGSLGYFGSSRGGRGVRYRG